MVVVETIVFAYVPNTQTPPAIYNIHGAPAINNTHLFYGGVPNFLATIPLNTTIYYNTVTGYSKIPEFYSLTFFSDGLDNVPNSMFDCLK